MAETEVGKNEINIDAIYPVGSIYITTVSTNPSTYFGGTWAAFGAGKALFGKDTAGTFLTAGSTGGAETNTHNHYQTVSFDGSGLYVSTTGATPRTRVISRNHIAPIGAANTGGNTREDSTFDETIGILPPYIVVYMWQRTA